jgi:hypothetical protein
MRFHSYNLPELWLWIPDVGAIHIEDHLVHFETDLEDIYDNFIYYYKGGNQGVCINSLLHSAEFWGSFTIIRD